MCNLHPARDQQVSIHLPAASHRSDQADQLLKEDLTSPGCLAAGGTTNVMMLQSADLVEQRTMNLKGHELRAKIF